MGSNPSAGTKMVGSSNLVRIQDFQSCDASSSLVPTTKWSVRLRARTSPFHGEDTGSNPVQTTKMAHSSIGQDERFSTFKEEFDSPMRYN